MSEEETTTEVVLICIFFTFTIRYELRMLNTADYFD
jgi:hypothetical protein